MFLNVPCLPAERRSRTNQTRSQVVINGEVVITLAAQLAKQWKLLKQSEIPPNIRAEIQLTGSIERHAHFNTTLLFLTETEHTTEDVHRLPFNQINTYLILPLEAGSRPSKVFLQSQTLASSKPEEIHFLKWLTLNESQTLYRVQSLHQSQTPQRKTSSTQALHYAGMKIKEKPSISVLNCLNPSKKVWEAQWDLEWQRILSNLPAMAG